MKIAHISLHIEFYAGIFRSRCDEAEVALKMRNVDWRVYIASPNQKYSSDKINYIPLFTFLSRLFESHNKLVFYLSRIFTLNFLLLRIAFNLEVNKLSKHNDYVIVRYNSADLFAFLFLKRKYKLLFYHHNKPAEEIKGYNKIAYRIEQLTGKAHHKNIKAIVGVTGEIGQYECQRNAVKRYFVIPNGIRFTDRSLVDNRDPHIIKIIMMCSSFQIYQGHDLLLKSICEYKGDMKYEVHFYGNAYPEQIREIQNTPNCFFHNSISQGHIPELLTYFDIGIGALAFWRNGLSEACTLKVREYLANGLPCVIGHTDIAFKHNFVFIKKLEKDFSFDQILDYAMRMKVVEKNHVKIAAQPFIEEKQLLENFIDELSGKVLTSNISDKSI